MAKKTRSGETKTTDYRHTGEKRTNNPPARIAAEGKVPAVPKVRYRYSPHLSPQLRFDATGRADTLPTLVDAAGKRQLTPTEQQQLADALRQHEPWLEWAGKHEQHERGFFEVDPVALHIHERISTQAMLRVLAREDVQRDLFADPQQPYSQAVQFYKHPVDWANRLILGDSLQVMTSLARRENLAGKIQMIYLDPPYGIKFSSNFQPQVGQRDVKDRDQDLTREPETVRAYRDTWTLGVHSYLAYLRDRFIAAKELLADSGSIFVQISDENLHRVRSLLDEVFGPENFVVIVAFLKTGGLSQSYLPATFDFLLWYAKAKHAVKARQVFETKESGADTDYQWLLLASGESRRMTADEREGDQQPPAESEPFQTTSLESANPTFPFSFAGRTFEQRWKSNHQGLTRLGRAERLFQATDKLRYVRRVEDFPAMPVTNVWSDTGSSGYRDPTIYVVQTTDKVIARCLLMTTDPGDLVLDPTCGSGTTAFVAEQWGRRWITCDTSRVALSLARQRLMTAKLPYYKLREISTDDTDRNPHGSWLNDPTAAITGKATFQNKTVSHITLKSIARNTALDPLFEKHERILTKRLEELNAIVKGASPDLRQKLKAALNEKQKRDGKRTITDADRRRWVLPPENRDRSAKWTVDANFAGWFEWEVPFDTDPNWPKPLHDALVAYRAAWRAKMNEINACIAANADVEELVDRPDVASGVVRVCGPFTVEGVRPEELSLGDEGLFDPTPNEFESETSESDSADRNVQSYLSQIIQHLRADGLTFLDNKHKKFVRLEPLFEDASASLIHAEGAWDDAKDGTNTVGVTFGPQHGPVTALQVEDAIRSANRYTDLVVAGFSFDAEVWPIVDQQNHPKLRIHIAQIRPDLNEAMNGLLKDTPNSQLFTVFGQPEIDVRETKEGWVCTLKGVDIYNPVENTVRSAGADKVAAWFLDSDFDGRCFCITQAFFPDQNAWEKIAKALGSSADLEAFAALKGTTSLPFSGGKYNRIAVKVIDPRGNEVMAIRKLS